MENNIGLIAYHLPLDMHFKYGNNIIILKNILKKPSNYSPFGLYHNNYIGWQTYLKNPMFIEEISSNLGILLNDNNFKYLAFGNKEIRKIAVVSGGAASCFDDAIKNKVDLFITGDRDHTLYHSAKENKINLLFAGHYFTETFGIKALQKAVEKKFNISTCFIDIPTSL